MKQTPGPLPFRLHAPGEDNMGAWGIESISYRAEGLLHLTDLGITLEWTETRTTEQVSIERVGTDVETFPREGVDFSFDQVTGARVAGGWWRPRLELRVRVTEDLEGVPGRRGVTLPLRIRRPDRALARAVAQAIQSRIANA